MEPHKLIARYSASQSSEESSLEGEASPATGHLRSHWILTKEAQEKGLKVLLWSEL